MEWRSPRAGEGILPGTLSMSKADGRGGEDPGTLPLAPPDEPYAPNPRPASCDAESLVVFKTA